MKASIEINIDIRLILVKGGTFFFTAISRETQYIDIEAVSILPMSNYKSLQTRVVASK